MFNNRGNILSALPPVTKIILITNVVMFVLTYFIPQVTGINLTKYLALYNFQSENFYPFQFLTHMFMHGSLGHIFFNMFGLYLFGRVLESVLGSKKFFTLYFVSGLAAALLHLGVNYLQIAGLENAISDFRIMPNAENFWQLAQKYHFDTSPEVKGLAQNWLNYPDNSGFLQQANVMCERMIFTMKGGVPMVGASGAIMGILAAFALMFPNVELMIIFFPVPIKAKYLVPVYAVAELFLGVANFQFDNIAHFAHLGGGIAGFLMVWYWKKGQFKKNMY